MHVLFDARLLHRPLSGLERVQKNLLRELALLPGIRRLSVAVLRGTRLPQDFPQQARVLEVDGGDDLLAHLLDPEPKARPDVYHLTYFPDRAPHELLLPIAAKASVVEVHDAILNRHPEYHASPAAHAAYDAFVRALVRSCDRLLVHSESVRGEVERDLGGDPQLCDLAPLAIDPDLARPLPAADVAARLARLSVAGEYFVAIGKDYPHKDHATLFAALAQVPRATLVCAGAKVWGQSSDELLARLGIAARVRFVQGLDDADIQALLQGSKGLVYPSREEGFGLPPIEAMALGVPVLAARAMSIPEVCGNGALLFPPGDAAALAGLLRQALAGGKALAAQVERGRQRAAWFSWRRCAEATFASYERALAASRGEARRRPVLTQELELALRLGATSPFRLALEVAEQKRRADALEQHARAVEANRDDILRQLDALRAAAGLAPVAPAAAPPRWSLKRRLGKIKNAIKKRLS